MNDFKLWSERNPEILENMRPDLGLSSWDDFSEGQKIEMWRHLNSVLYRVSKQSNSYTNDRYYFSFDGKSDNREICVYNTIERMNSLYRTNGYTPYFLLHNLNDSAQIDFYEIFVYQDQDVVFELLSLYAYERLKVRSNNKIPIRDGESHEGHQLRTEEWKKEPFRTLASELNDVFSQYGVNMILTDVGFMPRQDDKIINEIYTPVLSALSDSKWKKVNQELSDAFADFRTNTPTGYSSCVTHAVSSVQAFLQILVNGSTGKGEIGGLIALGKKSGLIPDDPFTKDISSILMNERQSKGDAHPKVEYANEKNARMVLNLCMIFFQHCIQN